MQQAFGQSQVLSQTLKLSPQMIQTISLLPLSSMELRERIFEELEKNPALELVNDPLDAPVLAHERVKPETIRKTEDASDAFQSFLESRSAPPETLQEHLLSQVRLLSVSSVELDLCEKIIQNLDSRGFHVEPPEYLFFPVTSGTAPDSCREQKTLEPKDRALLRRCLDIVRSLDPQGTACTDVQESLFYQASIRTDAPDCALEILKNNFDLLEKPRAPLLQKKLPGYSLQEIEDSLDFIRTLDPYPAAQYESGKTTFIAPDIVIRKKTLQESERDGDDEPYIVIAGGGQIPVIGLSGIFEKLAEKNSEQTDKNVKKTQVFVREQVKEARWFLESLENRHQTIVKTARALLHFQRPFFDRGPQFLSPLRLKDVAEFIGMHEATVSRIAASKYVQCDWGIFELKYFFPRAVAAVSAGPSKTGEPPQSKESVKLLVKQLIEEADSQNKKISDEKISKLLAERGVSVARRTVAKYRGELRINSSFDR